MLVLKKQLHISSWYFSLCLTYMTRVVSPASCQLDTTLGMTLTTSPRVGFVRFLRFRSLRFPEFEEAPICNQEAWKDLGMSHALTWFSLEYSSDDYRKNKGFVSNSCQLWLGVVQLDWLLERRLAR